MSKQGIVAMCIQKIDGDDGLKRLNCRALPSKEAAPSPSKSMETVPISDDSENSSTVPVVKHIQEIDGEEGVARLSRRAVNASPQKEAHDDEATVMRGLIFTPRECPPPGARSGLRSSTTPDERRKSRVSFAKDFGLDIGEESDVDMGLQSDGDDDDAGKNVTSSFALDDSDDDSDFDIDDEYDFDHEKLAELVKAGADRMELASHVEEAMAAALERKLARKAGTEPREASVLAATAAAEAAAAEGDQGDWDLEGRMTPGRMTPTDESATSASMQVDDVAARAKQALELANARRRRSSAARKNAAGIAQAMEDAKERRRKSLAKQFNTIGDTSVQIDEAMERARGRHRRSMSKAADVLECAGYDDDDADCTEAVAKMRLVQQAMEDARQRHRRSIARAVQELEEPLAKSQLNGDAQAFEPQQSFNTGSSHMQQPSWNQADSFNQYSPQGCWGGDCTDSWNCPSSNAQSRINQAVSSAYQSHCYQEGYPQQGYMQQDYMQHDGCQQNAYTGCGYTQQGHSQHSCTQGQQFYGQGDYQCGSQYAQGAYHQGDAQHCGAQYVQNDYQQCSYSGQCYGQEVATSNNQQCYQQETGYGQEAYNQQVGAQHSEDGYQASYGHQASNQYGQQFQQQTCDQYHNTQSEQAWQYGMQSCDASWNGQAVHTKDQSGWDNQQAYSAPWRLGSA